MNDGPHDTLEHENNLQEAARTAEISRLNDAFRAMPNPKHGEVLVTNAVHHLDDMTMRQLILLVRTFDAFSEDNDPYKEHDFGSIKLGGETYFWKIDLYDRATRTMYTPDPINPEVTWRVLTIMHAQEY